MMRWRRLLPMVGGLALVILLVGQIEPGDVMGHLANASLGWLAVGCGWYVVTNLLRAFRFGVLLNLPGWRVALAILPEMFALSFLNNVLPSRTGELSFPYFMQRRHQIPIGESATALLIARVFDYLAVISLYLIFALVELPNLAESAAQVIGWVIVLSAISVIFLAVAPWISSIVLDLLEKRLAAWEWNQHKVVCLLLGFSHDVVNALMRTRSLAIYLRSFGWSLLVWLSTFAC